MGVPKFYRWISERYPCLSQVVKDYQIPEFDNFYLDMNGIIHTCSHPNDDDPSFRISEEKIFSDIFRYLEALFRIIKPQKVLFMAIDGVAPRAKMNQQRGRRFRSAKEAEDQIKKAKAKGLELPTEARFDSNCITPGTAFMARLHEQLKYFINQKLSTDPSWQKVQVIFSGHEVPGEGEHKIMDYIRYSKAQPDYDPNTRHCLYGLDADLIMLGMATHEPHFCLLREEVKFGKNQKKQSSVDAVTFHLLHLSILREYLYYEFKALEDKISFPFNLESIIDDWILMGFLVGNDFIPHLPNMHIRQEILPFLYKIYMQTLPNLDGYINENGCLNMKRTEVYLRAVSEFDEDYFADLIADTRWLAGKKKNQKQETSNSTTTTESELDEDLDFGGLADLPTASSAAADEKLKRDLGIPDLEDYFKKEDKSRMDHFQVDMKAHKAIYYQEKFSLTDPPETVLKELGKCYVVGIQWVLSYYYTGVPSWSWFYPYHYAPYVSDIKGISDMSIQFELGSPFLPFEQLLAVLPANSRSLLPEAYQSLMLNGDSPVIDFYPTDFDYDLNGKQHDWEAVVLIPFIDEDRLIDAMKPLSTLLSEEEVQRNTHGPCLVYEYSRNNDPITYPSPWPTQFPDVQNCRVKCQVLSSDPYSVDPSELVWGLCPSVKLDVFFPGFPTLKHIPHENFRDSRSIRVFQAASRGESICLRVLPPTVQKETVDIARELVGKVCYVRWPYLIESKVWSVSDGQFTYYDDNEKYGGGAKGRKVALSQRSLTPEEGKLWRDAVVTIDKQYSSRNGIDIGDINILVYVEELQGKRFVTDRSGPKGVLILEKQWSASPTPYPLQTIVRSITEHAPEYKENVKTLEELFEVGSQVFILHPSCYGEQAEVMTVDSKRFKVNVKCTVKHEPQMDTVIGSYQNLNTQYSPLGQVAQRLGLNALLVSRITSSLQCERGSRDNKKERERINLGLNFKFSNRNQELVGYAKRTPRGWSLSPAAEDILKDYKEKFPSMFSYLLEHAQDDRFYEADLFPPNTNDDSQTITAAKEWVKSLPTNELTPVECGSDTLNESHILEIEKAVNSNKGMTSNKSFSYKYNPSQLYKPGDHQGGLIPDEHADFYLFDRVVNIASNGVVPFGLRGTLCGISGDGKDNKTMYEVVFDEEFLGGHALRCSSNRVYRLPPSCLLNLSYGRRWCSFLQQSATHHQSRTPNDRQSTGNGTYSSAVVASVTSPRGSNQEKGGTSYYVGKPYVHTKESSTGTRSMSDRSQGRKTTPIGKKKGETAFTTPPQVMSRNKQVTSSGGDKTSTATVNEFDLMVQSMTTHPTSAPQLSMATPPTSTPQLSMATHPTSAPQSSMATPPTSTPQFSMTTPSNSTPQLLTPQQLTASPLLATPPQLKQDKAGPFSMDTPPYRSPSFDGPFGAFPKLNFSDTGPVKTTLFGAVPTASTSNRPSVSKATPSSISKPLLASSNASSTSATFSTASDMFKAMGALKIDTNDTQTSTEPPTVGAVSDAPVLAPSVAAVFGHHGQMEEKTGRREGDSEVLAQGSVYVYVLRESGTNYYKVGKNEQKGNLQTGNPEALNEEKSYKVNNYTAAELAARKSVIEYKTDLKGGTEWYKVEPNEREMFFGKIHQAMAPFSDTSTEPPAVSKSSAPVFTPSVAAVFEHHKQKMTVDPEPVSPHTECKLKQEADLKSLLGISPRVPAPPQPRGPILPQPRGPNLSQQNLSHPSGPPMFTSPMSQPRGPTVVPQPRGPMSHPRGPSVSPQTRGPVNSVQSQTGGPIMSTGYQNPRHSLHSSPQGFQPPMSYYMPPHNNNPMVWYPGYPFSPYQMPFPPNQHDYARWRAPYLMNYIPPGLPPPAPSNPRGPKPPTTSPKRIAPPSSILNPFSTPFTPMQVQIRHGTKLGHTVSPPGDPQESPEKENLISPPLAPPATANAAKEEELRQRHQTTAEHTNESCRKLELLQQALATQETLTSQWPLPVQSNEEELVEAIQTTDTAAEEPSQVVGEILPLAQIS